MSTAQYALGAIPGALNPVICPPLGELEQLQSGEARFARSAVTCDFDSHPHREHVSSPSVRVPQGWTEAIGCHVARAGTPSNAPRLRYGGPSSPLAIWQTGPTHPTSYDGPIPAWALLLMGRRGSWVHQGQTVVCPWALEIDDTTASNVPLILRIGDELDSLGRILSSSGCRVVRVTLPDLSDTTANELTSLLACLGVRELQLEIPTRVADPTTLDHVLRHAASKQIHVASYVTDITDITDDKDAQQESIRDLSAIFELDPRCRVAISPAASVALYSRLERKPRPWATASVFDRRVTRTFLAPFRNGKGAVSPRPDEINVVVVHADAHAKHYRVIDHLSGPTTIIAHAESKHYRVYGTASTRLAQRHALRIERTEADRGAVQSNIAHIRADGVASQPTGPAIRHETVLHQSIASTIAALDQQSMQASCERRNS